ncbi:ubiquitin carboxyl-terminal hydrolase 38-like [Argopecten irradians]|uniref:ubiquitin carboxyl-terminal hydrolase 38-like n=1 Tax=Argopecten irradians TaxID=31199 RepID=UPI003718471E
MDNILVGILSSAHPDSLKKQLIQKIANRGSQPQPVKVIRSVLELMAKWYLEGDSDVALSEGLSVYKLWAKYNLSVFEEYFNRQYLLTLLSTTYRNEANAVTLLHESMILLQRSPVCSSHMQVIEAKAISYVREHPSLPCISNFVKFLKEFRSCVPKGDFTGRFCVALIDALSICSVPDTHEDIRQYVLHAENVSSLIKDIWERTDSEVVMMSLKAIFGIISSVDESGVEPSFCLGALAQHIPTEMLKMVVKFTINNPAIDNMMMTAALQRVVDWLQWPTARNIDLWIIAFLKGLAVAKRYSVLINVTETKIEQVFEKVSFPLVRSSAINVLSHMLFSFQHSPEPFHKILPMIPNIHKKLKKENTTESINALSRISDVLHCCMYLHAGYPDLYDSVLVLFKDYPKPDAESMRAKLVENKWTAQKSDSANYTSKVTQKSVTGKTGLFNLGNTCFLNSVVQALFMCDDFRRAVLAHSPTPRQQLMAKLQYVFAFLSHTQRPAYAAVTFLRIARPPWFTAGHQQDCSEFLKFLIDQLHEQEVHDLKKEVEDNHGEKDKDGDVTMASSQSNSDDDFETTVHEHFGGKMVTTYTCLKCMNESSRTEHFTDIPLAFPDTENLGDERTLVGGNGKEASPKGTGEKSPLQNSTNNSSDKDSTTNVSPKSKTEAVKQLHLNDLLQYYLQPEKLTGDNKYHCDKCGGLQEGERKIKVLKAPDHLILTLLRFSYNVKLQTRSKTFQEVKYPRTLILPVENSPQKEEVNKRKSLRSAVTGQMEQCGVNVNTKRGEVYGLCGVVVHSGTSSDCGHYYSYARHSIFCDPDTICDSLDKCKSEDDVDFLQDKWYLFNDNRVSHASYSSFCDVTQRFTKDTAYVLFYKRIDTKNAEKQELNMNNSFQAKDVDPPLRTDLRMALSKDNALYLQEQETMAQKKNQLKRPGSASTSSWFNWQRRDDDDEPPGSCGGGGGGKLGDLDTSGAKFIF